MVYLYALIMQQLKIYNIIFSITLIFIISPVVVYADEAGELKSNKKKFEFEAGTGYGILNYHIDTAAHSILKWRDSYNFQQNLKFKYNFREKVFAGILFENYILSGGEMTDDDLNNLYGTDSGVFNTTRSMKGNGHRFDFYGGYHYYTTGNTDFIGTFGVFFRKYKIRPKGVLQVGISEEFGPENKDYWVDYDNKNTQHAKITYQGFQLGTEIHHNTSDSSKFIFDIKLIIPLFYQSKQYHWGYKGPDYDWKLKQNSFIRNQGIELKMENRFKFNQYFWWGIYVYYSYIQSTNQNEIDWNWEGNPKSYIKTGNARSSALSMMGVGISAYF